MYYPLLDLLTLLHYPKTKYRIKREQTPITLPMINESRRLRELIIPTSELSAGTAAASTSQPRVRLGENGESSPMTPFIRPLMPVIWLRCRANSARVSYACLEQVGIRKCRNEDGEGNSPQDLIRHTVTAVDPIPL